MINLGLLIKTNNDYHIIDDYQLQGTFEIIDAVIKIYPNELQQQDKLLWTLPQGRSNPPLKISTQFEYLNSWVQKLVQTTRERLVFFAPYYSESGIDLLAISLSELLEVHKNILIDFIVSDISNVENKKAFDYIGIKFQSENVRILKVSDESSNFSFHAKLLLSDGERGYLGSANFSRNGLERHFELGVRLNGTQTKTLTNLIDYWIRMGILEQGV